MLAEKENIMRVVRDILWIISVFVFSSGAMAQSATIELGPDEIALNQAFTITITVHNERLQQYDPFPEIPGFVKRGTSSSSSTNFINGQRSSSQSITQNYVATAEGTFVLKPFTLKINNRQVQSPGKRIKVGPPLQQRTRRDPFNYDPFQDFFGRKNAPQEFVDVKADAFLALTTDKSEVYVGEGFTVTIAFYVSEKNRADMRFYELGKQIPEIVKQIKPANCWEENFNIDNINGDPVTINNQRYSQYKIFQATYYPLNNNPIQFPSVGLELIKYKVAKNPTFFGRNKQENLEKFLSKPKMVIVTDLPPHPLKDRVAVGNYRLQEKISGNELRTGESFNYSFNIAGEGNISAVEKPEVTANENFDLYPPNIRQNINRSNGKVHGVKSFSYYGIPNEPGSFSLKDYFSWIYFNPDKETYDTLKSEMIVNVNGESKKNQYILSNDLGAFYDSIELRDNTLFDLDEQKSMQAIANIFILVLLIASGFVIFKK